LHVTNFSDASSLLPLTEAGREQWHLSEVQQVPAELHRLDDYFATKRLPMPNLLKLDVQGCEMEVLKGAPRALGHAKAIIAEVSFREFYKGQCRFDQVVSYLAERGLFVHAIGQRTVWGKPLVQADVLFLRDN
jgi:Methyltransferase FkbM domain